MNIYEIKSDLLETPDMVVAPSMNEAIKTYCERYSPKNGFSRGCMTDENITSIKRVAEKCLISEK